MTRTRRHVQILIVLALLGGAVAASLAQQKPADAVAEQIVTTELDKLATGLRAEDVDLVRRWLGADVGGMGRGAWKQLKYLRSMAPAAKAKPVGLMAITQQTLGTYAPIADTTTLLCLGNVGALSPALDKTNGLCADAGMYLALVQLMDDLAAGRSTSSSAPAAFIACLQKALTKVGTEGNTIAAIIGLVSWASNEAAAGLKEWAHETAWKSYSKYYAAEYSPDRWVQVWENQGPQAALKILRTEFWGAAEGLTLRGQWTVKTFERDYQDRFAYGYLQTTVAPILKAHFLQKAHAERAKAIQALRRALAELPLRKVVLSFDLVPVGADGKPLKADLRGLSVTARVKDKVLAEAQVRGRTVYLSLPLLDFLRSLGPEREVELSARAAQQGKGSFPRLVLRPATLRLDAAGLARRYMVQASESHTVIERLRPLALVVPVRTVVVKVTGTGARGVAGPDGKVVKVSAAGLAFVEVPTVGRSWISLVDGSGRPTGEGAVVDGQSGRVEVSIHASSQQPPPLPPAPSFDGGNYIAQARQGLGKYQALQIGHDDAHAQVSGALAQGDIAAQAALRQWASYERAWIRRHPQASEQEEKQLQAQHQRLLTAIARWKQDRQDVLAELQAADKALSDRLVQVAEDVSGAAKALNEAARELDANLETTRSALALAQKLGQPRRFARMADIEADRKRLAQAAEAVRRAASDLDALRKQVELKDQDLALEVERLDKLASRAGGVEYSGAVGPGRAIRDARASAAGAKQFADHAADLAETYSTTHQTEATLKAIEAADGKLSWLQLSCLEWTQLAERCQEVAAKPPVDPGALAPDLKAADTVNRELELAMMRVTAGGAGKSNGFGVDAYEHYVRATKAWEPVALELEKRRSAVRKWLAEVDAARQAVGNALQNLRASGWGVADIEQGLTRTLQEGEKEGAVRHWLSVMQDTDAALARARQAWAASPVSRAGLNWDALLQANLRCLALAQQAKAAVQAGRADEARKALAQVGQVLSNAPFVGTAVVPAELQRLERLSNLLDQVWRALQDLDKRNLASLTLSVKAEGGASAQAVSLVVEGPGVHLETTGGSTLRLPAGEYTITASGTGVVIEPAQHKVSLKAQGAATVRFTVRPAVGGPGATKVAPPKVVVKQYDFAHPTRKVLALNLGLPDWPPVAWTPDGRRMVAVATGATG
ncbi:MAG: hypothetical protein J7M26_10455, partial [Armatimonadetes bacterium]|nr:hypothetical protein [Armatimonadota bacterium]